MATSAKPLVRVKRGDRGVLVADALHVFSVERYNDGLPARHVTLFWLCTSLSAIIPAYSYVDDGGLKVLRTDRIWRWT